MARLKLVYNCSDCGASFPKWAGRCTSCGAWNTLVEDVEDPANDISSLAAGIALLAASPAQRIGDVDVSNGSPRSTGIPEFDRVLGGGLVPGSVTLLGGEPGVGKSTLLLQALAAWPGRTLYVSAEESAQQVRLRAERLGAVRPELWLLAETVLPHVLAALDELQPELVIIDSIQTLVDPELGSAPGSVVQVRGCAHKLVMEAKRRNVPIILVGHVTKEGGLAGPRVLEHVVDTVLQFEGERHHALRLLRASKHRFGPTTELGLFEMIEAGLRGVPDPSALFLADRQTGIAGSVVVPTLEGQRPLMVEVQVLVNEVKGEAPPRRSAQGLDPGRLAMLLAVLDQRTKSPVGKRDVYASVVGGVRITEPGADLGLCLAILSALANTPLPPHVVAFGEVGLGGEIRQVPHASRRLAEAARLGFTRAIVPAKSPDVDVSIGVERVSNLRDAMRALGLGVAASDR
ncbi:MAG: DNA repair protein RadA [Acidimicrobiales bacterium mtb01]|nr:DNA repair protein RadA [Actinomycetota bacterium]TEX46771.1 MAG: DNA repair protein RadA [Acidimicrobiales bacterium mtb01]